MGSRQPPRIAGRKKAMQFSAPPDLKSKRNARNGYCSITIIPSRRRDPAVIGVDGGASRHSFSAANLKVW
jgi:hypothetical protein